MSKYDRDVMLGGLDEFDAPREPVPFRLTVNGTDRLASLIPGEAVNDYGTDGIYLDCSRRIWRVVHNNRLHPCEWPYEYRKLAEQCFAELCNPHPEGYDAQFQAYDYKD